MMFQKGIAVGQFVAFVLVVCMEFNEAVRCVEREREGLLRFKKGLTDENGILSSWRESKDNDKDCCKWKGVVCSASNINTSAHVVALQLPHSLRGKISDGLLELHHLTNLDFSMNGFDEFPQVIGSMKQLKHLNLGNCFLPGTTTVPPQLGNLTNLRTLNLSFNSFRPSVNLDWLSHLSFLTQLDLSGSFDLSHSSWFPQILKLRSLQELHLFRCNISAIVPPFPFAKNNSSLTALSILDLSHNDFEGDLEELELKAFPSLRKLNLSNNNFVGSMPRSLSQHSLLEELDVSFNSLEGTISEAYFAKLHNLKFLDLSFNSLTLQIAQDWIPPFQLDVIKLAGCEMSFPEWIRTQKDVSILDLSSAGISNEVPKWLWSLSPALTYLNISYNHINGTIPHLFSSSFTYLDVRSNKLSGPLPLLGQNIYVVQLSQNMFSGSISSICSLVNVWFLDLSDNQFSGEIPNCWDKMSGLEYLNLGDNSFFGEMPPTLGTLRFLDSLTLRGNNLSGELPSTLRNCTELMFIDVGGNKLTGNIPAWIGENIYLMYVILSGNEFHGSIPLEICSLTHIRVLDLSKNNISGEIPHCFNKLTSLAEKNANAPEAPIAISSALCMLRRVYEYAVLQWKGGEFKYKKIINHLRLIDLSSNRLVGTIPESFSSMRGLISLNLSRNLLEGTIISRIGEMEMLEVLDLSKNQLYGHIPISLAQLHFLSVLDLANNSLSGKIPSSTQMQSFDASVYDGNDELCGIPLKLCLEDVPKQGKDMKEDGGSVSLSFMQGFVISIISGFIVGFWGVFASLVLKRSWRYAYFQFLDEVKDWLCIKTALLFKASTPT